MYSNLPATEGRKVVWFHCASLGEFDQGLPLMNKIKERNPEVFLLVSFFSPSGMEHYNKRNHQVDHVTYIPLDTNARATKFISTYKPEIVFFVKYEYWSRHIFAAKKSGAKIYNVSGLFRPGHRFFKWYGSYFRKTLRAFDHFFLQTEESQELLKSINIYNTSVTGDTRYDKVIDNKNNMTPDEALGTFAQNKDVLVIGSSWPEDERVLLPFINQSDIRVIIAPHDISEPHIIGIEKKLSRPYVRYTEINDSASNADVIILNTIGHLASAYYYGKIAYVGGGFSGSLHNILEPAVFGLPVIFGPKYSRFPEASDFIKHGFGFSIDNTTAFIEAYDEIHNNLENISAREVSYVESHSGVTDKILEHLSSSSVL